MHIFHVVLEVRKKKQVNGMVVFTLSVDINTQLYHFTRVKRLYHFIYGF